MTATIGDAMDAMKRGDVEHAKQLCAEIRAAAPPRADAIRRDDVTHERRDTELTAENALALALKPAADLSRLIEAACLARQCDASGSVHGGADAARKLRRELADARVEHSEHYIRVRCEGVLEMHGWRRDAADSPEAIAGFLPAGSYSRVPGGMLKWPDEHPSEYDARKALTAAGVNHAQLDEAGVHAAITSLRDDDDDDDTEDRTDAADRAALVASDWLEQYAVKPGPLDLRPLVVAPPATPRKRRR